MKKIALLFTCLFGALLLHAQDYTQLYLIGSAIPNGEIQLSAHPSGIPSILYYTGELKQGTLRFSTNSQEDTDTQYYIPVEEDIDILDASDIQVTKNSNAMGWNVAVAAPYYKIIVNLADKTIKVVRIQASQELYLIGGATEAGWSTEKAIAFTKDEHNPNLFSIETELKIREEFVENNAFKIVCQKDWGPNSLHPYVGRESILHSKTFVENGDDTKWTIDASQQGRYRIIVNLLEETVKASFFNETDVDR